MKQWQVSLISVKGQESVKLEETVEAENEANALREVLKRRALSFPDVDTATIKEKIESRVKERVKRIKRLVK